MPEEVGRKENSILIEEDWMKREMKAIEIYLVTNGNGLAAVDFYKDAFDAEIISCTTYGQAILNTAEALKNYVLNAQLRIGDIRLQISDNSPQYDYVQGTNMSACLQCENVEEARKIFDKLSVDAKSIDHDFKEVPWSPGYGIVVDQFGMTWQVNTDIEGFVSETVTF